MRVVNEYPVEISIVVNEQVVPGRAEHEAGRRSPGRRVHLPVAPVRRRPRPGASSRKRKPSRCGSSDVRGCGCSECGTLQKEPSQAVFHLCDSALHSDSELTMIITIDGPAGSGRAPSTKALAARLGFEYLDTGAMYRAVALAALRRGHRARRRRRGRGRDSPDVRVEMPPGRVLSNGEDVTARDPHAGSVAGREQGRGDPGRAAVPRRRAAARSPRAATSSARAATRARSCSRTPRCKFFLTADSAVRAERRHRELAAQGRASHARRGARGPGRARPRATPSRDLAPMRPAADAVARSTPPHLHRADDRRCDRAGSGGRSAECLPTART